MFSGQLTTPEDFHTTPALHSLNSVLGPEVLGHCISSFKRVMCISCQLYEYVHACELEPCADVIVSAAARRRSQKSACAALAANSFYPKNFLLLIENCNKISAKQQWHRRRGARL